jgi:iron(III) transport system substrate-binding protein
LLRSTRSLLGLLLLALAAASILFAACGDDDDGPTAGPDPEADPTAGADPVAGSPEALTGDLIIYSGRREPLFQPVVDAFEEATGIDVSVKYGSTTELGNALIEEKGNVRADVFVGTDAATAEALGERGVFAPFDDPALAALPAGFRADDGSWIGVSGRARVIMYNSEMVAEADLPKSVFDLTDEKWKGKIAIPSTTNSSFTAWVSSLRKLKGDEATETFLRGLKDNDVEVLAEHTDVRNAEGAEDTGVLVNAAAASIVAGAPHAPNAQAFMRFLLGSEAQKIFAETNFEYPLVPGVAETRAEVKRGTFKESQVSLVELGQMNESTLDLLEEMGLE